MDTAFGVLLAASVALASVAPDGSQAWARAAALAGSDLRREYQAQCEPAPPAPSHPAGTAPPAPERVLVEPTKVFDNLYYFGDSMVGATVLKTSAGLILIDSLTTSEDAAAILVPGMRKLGLDPRTIKYVLVTHAHGDHHGGIKYLRENFPGFRVVMTNTDWDFAAKPFFMRDGTPDKAPKPPRIAADIGYSGATTVTLGDTTVTLVETPGHTPGTQSLLYPVKWQGKSYMAMQWGGGAPETGQYRQEVVDAFFARAKAAHAAVRWWSHNSPETRARMAQLRSGAAANPLIFGEERFARYLDIIALCKRAAPPAPARD